MPTRRPDPDPQSAAAAETYGLSDALPTAPELPGEVIVAASVDELIDLLAADLVVHAENCVRQFGDFHLALSGGSTPQPLYERLMYDPNYRRLPWRRTHLWLVDERRVPFDDERSNFRMIHETIVEHADIPVEQVHPMPPLVDAPDIDYERELRESLAWREKGQDRLDYVLLGMGEDGHTASLFPHTAPVRERERFVLVNEGRNVVPPDRITMTLPLINSARLIAIMVTGAKKAAMLRRVAQRDGTVDDLPIRGIHPLNGELKWYLDAAACSDA